MMDVGGTTIMIEKGRRQTDTGIGKGRGTEKGERDTRSEEGIDDEFL